MSQIGKYRQATAPAPGSVATEQRREWGARLDERRETPLADQAGREALRKKILVLFDGDYPWDVRVEKICRSFAKASWEVHLICRNKKQRPTIEKIEAYTVHRLPVISTKLNNLFNFPFFLNPVWLLAMHRLVSKYHLQAILVRDLPMAIAGLVIASWHRIPCFIDMAEPYPEMLEGYSFLQKLSWRQKLINFLVRNPRFAHFIERFSCKYLTHIFPVSDEISKNLVAKGVNGQKITVVHNTPEVGHAALSGTQHVCIDRQQEDGEVNILYIGDLTEARGLPVTIHAVQRLIAQARKVRFTIVGAGRFENNLKQLVADLHLTQHVGFSGWVEHGNLKSYLKEADIGIIPHLKIAHNDLTIPNKIFDYMQFGIPIVSADLDPINRILAETSAGLIFKQYTAECLAETLLKLLDFPLRAKLGRNAKTASLTRYYWAHDFSKMETIINHEISNHCHR